MQLPYGIPAPKQIFFDPPHGIRNVRRNADANDKHLVMEATNIDDVQSYKKFSLDGLREVARNISLPAYGLSKILNINTWFEQRSNAAFHMIKLETIYMFEAACPADVATALALKACYFSFEPYKNHCLNNPFWITEMLARGSGIWELQERYITKVLKATPKADFLFSYQVLQQIVSLTQGGVNYLLTFHRHQCGTDRKWHKATLARINQDVLEGLHSKVRNQTRNNNVNCNAAEFQDFLSRSLIEMTDEMWLTEWGVPEELFHDPKSCQDPLTKTLGLWVEVPFTSEYCYKRQSYLSDPPPACYDAFMAKATEAWNRGKNWARHEYAKVLPVAHQQFVHERQWQETNGTRVMHIFQRPEGM